MGDDSAGPVAAAPDGRSRRDGEAATTPGSLAVPEQRGLRGPHEGRTERDVLAAIADDAGLRRIHFVAWRDLDDPEAGGSELHAHKVASLWAAAGLDVTFRTSAVPGAPAALTRDGYRVLRRSGRYAVFPGAAWEGLRMGHRPGDALVEIWNGMPFLSPLWYRGPSVVFLHHVHAEMWGMVLPPTLARMGDTVERRIAPRFYRSSRIVTLSESSRREIVDMLHLPADRVTVAPPGVDERYRPGGQRSATPLVVAVGRLVPVKRFDALLRALARAKADHPDLTAVIVGEGYERPALEALRDELGATEWVHLPGRVNDEELVDWYRRAWVVASSSQREGWGMTLTEAAACGTPAVATDIAGHADAVVDGESGLLVENVDEMAAALSRVLGDQVLRSRLSRGALARARWFTWDATARRALEALAGEVTSAR
ncbi:MAG TPA: glycosyltransferase family 4 protein [Acidimicrobiales bacterium]|jgi:glycosyltransferase involved in cell wall biosynthesis|nr:glycosyltransferase family 4 protein [Acidimicrobiales bacterium]